MPNHNRLLYLDSLRGIAALSVAMSHFLERTPLHNWLFFHYFNPGQFGVAVFFILSGMVIPYSLSSTDNTIRKFMISRFFRLYPAYWFSVGLAIIASIYFLKIVPTHSTIFLNFTMLQALFFKPDLFGVYWTLIIELIFYASCVFLTWVGFLQKPRYQFCMAVLLLMSALALASVRYIIERKLPVAIPLAMSFMFFGGIWRSATVEKNTEARRLATIWIISFLLLLPLICALAYFKDFGHGENSASYMGSYLSAFVFLLVCSTRLKINVREIVFLGTISYSVYLIHPFFLEFISSRIQMKQAFNPVAFIAYLVMTVTLSVFSYYAIEKPSIQLGRKFKKRVSVG